MMRQLLVCCASLLFLSGCDFITGKEVARLRMDGVSTGGTQRMQEATVDLQAQEQVALWSDMDLSYDGEVALRFLVEVLRDSVPVSQLEVDPMDMNITVGERRTVAGDHTEWSYSAKHDIVKADAPGRYTFRAVLVADDTTGLLVRKAELVLRK